MPCTCSSYFARFSLFLGTSEPALKLLLCLLAGYPVAWIYRKFIHSKDKPFHHIYFALCGLGLGFWNYGFGMFHPVFAIASTYGTLYTLGATDNTVAGICIYNMGHLLLGYLISGSSDYDFNWTIPQCVLTLRLIGVTFDIYNGQKPANELSDDNKVSALQKLPTVYEFFGFMLFPSTFLVGPQFHMVRYQKFVAGEYNDGDGPPPSVSAAMIRFGQAVVYLLMHCYLGKVVNEDYMDSIRFFSLNIWKKLLMLAIYGRYCMYKYVCCWLFAEGSCTLFGISSNGVDENGAPRWDGVVNVNLAILETATQFSQIIQSFNISTNLWVKQYVYKQLKFLDNRYYSLAGALLFLAVWHGFHSGYYVFFFYEFLLLYLENDVKEIVGSNENVTNFLSRPDINVIKTVLLKAYMFVMIGFTLLPFTLLVYCRYWPSFNAVYHFGNVILLPYPFVYSPLFKLLFNKIQ